MLPHSLTDFYLCFEDLLVGHCGSNVPSFFSLGVWERQVKWVSLPTSSSVLSFETCYHTVWDTFSQVLRPYCWVNVWSNVSSFFPLDVCYLCFEDLLVGHCGSNVSSFFSLLGALHTMDVRSRERRSGAVTLSDRLKYPGFRHLPWLVHFWWCALEISDYFKQLFPAFQTLILGF